MSIKFNLSTHPQHGPKRQDRQYQTQANIDIAMLKYQQLS